MKFKFYNPNPCNKYVGDCVIRAITKTESISWQDAFIDIMIEAFSLCDMPSSNYVWGSYLKSKGYARQNLPDSCPDCYTANQFCEDHPTGTFIIATGTHVIAVVDGILYDSWDSGDEIVTYYWQNGE